MVFQQSCAVLPRSSVASATMAILFLSSVELSAAVTAGTKGSGDGDGGVTEVASFGANALRVTVPRAGAEVSEQPSPLLPRTDASPTSCAAGSSATNGNLRVECSASGRTFRRVLDNAALLQESVSFASPPLQHNKVDALHVPARNTAHHHRHTNSEWAPPDAPPAVTVTVSVGSAEVFGLGQQRATCYPEGGRQTNPLSRAFVPGQVTTCVVCAITDCAIPGHSLCQAWRH